MFIKIKQRWVPCWAEDGGIFSSWSSHFCTLGWSPWLTFIGFYLGTGKLPMGRQCPKAYAGLPTSQATIPRHCSHILWVEKCHHLCANQDTVKGKRNCQYHTAMGVAKTGGDVNHPSSPIFFIGLQFHIVYLSQV